MTGTTCMLRPQPRHLPAPAPTGDPACPSAAPPSPPPPPETRVAVPAPVVEAPEAAATPVYQDKGFLVVKAVLPQERNGRVRLGYTDLVFCVTGTLPPQHSNTGQRSLHQQKEGMIDFLLPLGVTVMPSSIKKGASRRGRVYRCTDGQIILNIILCEQFILSENHLSISP